MNPRLNKSGAETYKNSNGYDNKPDSVKHICVKSHAELEIFTQGSTYWTVHLGSALVDPLPSMGITSIRPSGKILFKPPSATKLVTFGTLIFQNPHAILEKNRAARRLFWGYQGRRRTKKSWIIIFLKQSSHPESSFGSGKIYSFIFCTMIKKQGMRSYQQTNAKHNNGCNEKC